MPTLAGWLTGEQVPQEVIEQTLTAMGNVLGLHGGRLARSIQPGAGLIAFSDPAYAMQHNDGPSVLDWIPDRRTFVYRRPLSGLHALYYIENWPTPGNLLFASEIKALLTVGVPRRLHLAALDALLRYGFIPAPWTIFKDIRVVPAGSLLRWQRGMTIVNHATDYHLEKPLTQVDSLIQLHKQFDQVVANILPPHEQLVALAGGDSASALPVALAAQHTSTLFTVASIGYKKSLSAKIWRNTERIAAACQRPFLAITGVDQPEFWTATLAGLEAPVVDARPLVLHQLLHTVAVETGARVAISGLGAHPLLLQYPHRTRERFDASPHPATQSAPGYREKPKRSGDFVSGKQASSDTEPGDTLHWYRQALLTQQHKKPPRLWSQDAASLLQDEEQWEDTLHARKLARQAAKFADKRQRYYYLDLHLRLPDSVVNGVQQLATQERMVVRSPYLDARMIDTLTRLPSTLEGGLTKDALPSALLKQYIAEGIEEQSTLPLDGPIASLLRVADSDLLQQTLAPAAIRATGIFHPQAVEDLLKGKGNNIAKRELLLVFTTQLLCQLFGISL